MRRQRRTLPLIERGWVAGRVCGGIFGDAHADLIERDIAAAAQHIVCVVNQACLIAPPQHAGTAMTTIEERHGVAPKLLHHPPNPASGRWFREQVHVVVINTEASS